MSNDYLKVPKNLKKITLWVHPEGRVIGSLFTRKQSPLHAGEEDACESLNQDETFLVLKRDEPEEIRFYNKSSIIRMEYKDEEASSSSDASPLFCKLHMMDGAIINGEIKESLPPDQTRLYDYLNKKDERFIKVHINKDTIYLINKSYINQAVEPDRSTASE